jgi:hypothetical protein
MASFTNSDDDEDPALALRLSQMSVHAFDEQVAQLQSQEAAPVDASPRQPTPLGQNDEDDLGLALNLSHFPAEIVDEQVGDLHKRRETRRAIDDVPASLSAERPGPEVRS